MDYKKDYYNTLEVDTRATAETLKASYRRLAKLHHPDKNPGNPEAEERFKDINEAYEILGNEITRHIYDRYREKDKRESETKPSVDEKEKASGPFKASQTTKTRTYTVQREKRIYVRGTIEVKFQGDPELSDVYARQWEQRFTIFPTEVLVTILSSEVFAGPVPEEYLQGYSAIELFTTPLRQPINCKIITATGEEYYLLELYDIRVMSPVLKDITRHEQYSFGTLQGELFGYVLHLFDEKVTDEYTEYSGATGHVETRTASGYVFVRQQFYAADGTTYWDEWKISPHRAGKHFARHRNTGTYVPQERQDGWSDWWWLIFLVILFLIYPPLLPVAFAIMGVALVFFLLGWLVSSFDKAFPWLGAIIIGLIVVFGVRSLYRSTGDRSPHIGDQKYDSIRSERNIVQEDDRRDTLITHDLRWEDRDSTRFSIRLSMPLSAIRKLAADHEQMDEERYGFQGIGAVYRHMLSADGDDMRPIAAVFDSLARARSLDRQQEASMMMSCIQSIPYAIIVDRGCSDHYSDEYVSQYLSRCPGDCCKGYSKFGVQSPVEFMGDLKGDCDTRALFLFDVLGQLGYKVALMTSNYYKHALIAVQIKGMPAGKTAEVRIDGEPYYLWETTSKGFGPGELPAALSNMSYWDIALKN